VLDSPSGGREPREQVAATRKNRLKFNLESGAVGLVRQVIRHPLLATARVARGQKGGIHARNGDQVAQEIGNAGHVIL